MQLTTLVTTVDFFPEAFIADEGVKRFQKRVTFNSNGLKSYSTVTMLTARNEWESRIANGAEVTDLNLDQMPRSEYAPMAVGWSEGHTFGKIERQTVLTLIHFFIIMVFDLPIYKKQLPQVWLEDGKFIIESDSFRYVIKDDLKLLFKLCRRFKSDAIAQTYATN